VQFVRTGPAGNLAMIGKTERTLKRNVIDPLVDMLGPKRCRYVAGAGNCGCADGASTSPAPTTNVPKTRSVD
jgi:hypothetical protein